MGLNINDKILRTYQVDFISFFFGGAFLFLFFLISYSEVAILFSLSSFERAVIFVILSYLVGNIGISVGSFIQENIFNLLNPDELKVTESDISFLRKLSRSEKQICNHYDDIIYSITFWHGVSFFSVLSAVLFFYEYFILFGFFALFFFIFAQFRHHVLAREETEFIKSLMETP